MDREGINNDRLLVPQKKQVPQKGEEGIKEVKPSEEIIMKKKK